MFWKILAIYCVVAITNFFINLYRMLHTKYLYNKYLKNINNKNFQQNFELAIPIKKVLSKAHKSYFSLESDLKMHFLSCDLDNAFIEAFYHYKYLMKHCFTWVARIPTPKTKAVNSQKLNLLIRFLIFAISTITVYLFGLYLDNSGLGLKILNYLSAFVKDIT